MWVLIVVWVVPIDGVPLQRTLAREQWDEIYSVEMLVGACRLTGDGKDRWVEVGADDRLIGNRIGLSLPWPLDNQRHAQASFVIASLVRPQRGIACSLGKAPIVTGKDN